MNIKTWFIILAIFWLVIIVGFIGVKEYTLRTGQEVLLKTQPIDPRDLFRGDYVILSYEISTLDLNIITTDATEFNSFDKVYVTISVDNGYGVATGVYKNQPQRGQFIKGTVKNSRDELVIVEYGIESYFVPEGKGLEIQRQSGRALDVKVAIDASGNAVIKNLLI